MDFGSEEFYTVGDLAELLKVSESTVRRMFVDEPGVVRIGRASARSGKREYLTLRIPKSVAMRVLRDLECC